MKIVTTSILLVITLVAVPIVSWFSGISPGEEEWHVIHTLLIIAGIAAAYSFLVGEATANNSQVDKLWSLLPIAYVWTVAVSGGLTLRLVLMAILVTIWGVRLTINFAMKGAYTWRFWAGEEDYRWVVLRQKKEFQPRWKWSIFNLFFISGYQNLLILLFTLPAVVVMQNANTPFNFIDIIGCLLMVLFIVMETVADIQQWQFQSRKRRFLLNGEELTGSYRKGFLDTGLWSWSRHPNYFAEQAIWVSFYLFSVAASGQWFNWSIAGCLLLIVLFQGSSAFSEEISAGKYPEYSSYQTKVSRFFPIPKTNKPD
jgi:steroid 5-alpha reductase family enzyme